MVWCQALPIEREQPMALEVAEDAIVTQDVETIVSSFETTTRLVATIRTGSDPSSKQCSTFVRSKPPYMVEDLVIRQRRVAIQHRGRDLRLGVRIKVDQRDLGSGLGGGDQALPRSGTSTRFMNAGIILRNSPNMRSLYVRASANG